MEYLPGFTVQCINPQCEARGHWLRADITAPTSNDGRCPCCGDFLRNVPPPLGPRFRMRPPSLTAPPPPRPPPPWRMGNAPSSWGNLGDFFPSYTAPLFSAAVKFCFFCDPAAPPPGGPSHC